MNGHRAQVDDDAGAGAGRRPRHTRRALRDQATRACRRVHDCVAADEGARKLALVEGISDAAVQPEP
jgi:hypothetical protein